VVHPTGMKIMAANHTKGRAWPIMAEVVVGVVVVYFLLGGYAWTPAIWAVFTVMAVWIVIKNLLRDTGLNSEGEYQRYKQQIGLLMVVALLASPIWLDSWWPFVLGVVLGAVWLQDRKQLAREWKPKGR